jgi:hypothetical protein
MVVATWIFSMGMAGMNFPKTPATGESWGRFDETVSAEIYG